MSDCLFCDKTRMKILCGETTFFRILFDPNPVSSGHSLVVPKRHVDSLFDLTDQEWIELKPAIQEAITIIESTNLKKIYQEQIASDASEKSKSFCREVLRQKGKPSAYNIGVNNGEAAGRTIHHLHIQIIPRYKGDVQDPIGGIRNIIPNKGNYQE
jgi:diadenosine tetraphosphate (Ap4A) HIT family hydrolase